MMNSIEFIDKVSSGLWEDRFNVMMILFISKVLKMNDDGKGYNWEGVSKDEFKELICSQLLEMEYDDEMKIEISNVFRILSEYGEDGRSLND